MEEQTDVEQSADLPHRYTNDERRQGRNYLWIADPGEESECRLNKTIYNGAAGTLWALCELSKKLNRNLPFDPIKLSEGIHSLYLQEPDLGSIAPSMIIGETGIPNTIAKDVPF